MTNPYLMKLTEINSLLETTKYALAKQSNIEIADKDGRFRNLSRRLTVLEEFYMDAYRIVNND